MNCVIEAALLGLMMIALARPPLAAGEILTAPGPAATSITQSIPPQMKLGALPLRAPEPEDNPNTAAKIALGRLLFFDPILSSTKTVACATCHQPRLGWTNGRALPIGVGGTGFGPARTLRDPTSLPLLDRNVPTILNVGFNGLVTGLNPDPATAPMFWDSRAQGLEQQVYTPIKSRGEMRGDDCEEENAVAEATGRIRAISQYRELFRTAFEQNDAAAVTPKHLAQAIAAFERSLVTPRAAFDRFLEGDPTALTAEQQRGLRVFQDAGCVQCHGGPMFSDFKMHFIDVPDGADSGRREFRTPTLRNLQHTAPYMHNGGLRSLRDVLVFYDQLAESVAETLDGGDTSAQPRLDPLLKQLNLGPEDFPALEAFLNALSDEDYDQSAPVKVPSGLPVIQQPPPANTK
jgi:cytochrome c peroxidase